MGRWSEKEESRTWEFEMGTSGEMMNRSKMEPEELEYRVGREIGWIRE